MTDEATAEAPPITPENVVSRPEQPSAPDSSILRGRLDRMLRDPEPEPQQSETYGLREQIEQIKHLLGDERRQQKRDPDPNPYDKRIQELEAAQRKLQEELSSRTEQQEMSETSREVTNWVRSNEQHFPLLNKAGYQAVVFQKILNTKQQTGRVIDAAQAAREAEDELSALIERCAPQIGYVKRQEQTAGSDEDEISTTTPGMNVSLPKKLDDMSDEEELAYLLQQFGENRR